MNKKRMAVNVTAQIISFAVSMGINLLLSPFIVSHFSKEAYGFVTLGSDFVLYAQILVSALNTMASRFIVIHLHQDDTENASRYFTSVLFSNVIMVVILFIPTTVLILFLDRILNIDQKILGDVQVLWGFIFANFFISIITSVYGVATYARDRLDLTAIKTIQTELIRAAILTCAYLFLRPYLWYIGFASIICTIYMAIANRKFTKQLLPEIQIKKKFFDWKKVRELLSLGVWNSITRLGQALLEQLDLLISNLLIGGDAMGTLSIAKLVPMFITNLMGSIVGVFNPQITIAYAKGNKEELVSIIKSCNRILILLLSIPIAFVTIFADKFYALWQPKFNPSELYYLSLLTMGTLYISMSIQVLYHVFIITKKVRLNAIVMLSSGIITTAIVFILLNITNWGLFVIAGVSTVIGIIRNLTFTPLYAAKCLEVKWYTFYNDIGTGLFSILMISAIGYIARGFIVPHSWLSLIAVGIVVGILALVVNFYIILKREDRETVKGYIANKLHKA